MTKGLGITIGPFCASSLEARDKYRIIRNQKKEEGVAKKKRKVQRVAEKWAEEARIMEEGISYEAGRGFD